MYFYLKYIILIENLYKILFNKLKSVLLKMIYLETNSYLLKIKHMFIEEILKELFQKDIYFG
jgi:hypothetical protein